MTPGDLGMKAARFCHSCVSADAESLQGFGHEFRRPHPCAGMVGGGKRPRPGAAPQYGPFLIFVLASCIVPRAFSARVCRCLGGGDGAMTRGSKESTSDAGGTSRAYADTHYLLSIIFEEGDAEAARHLLYTLRGRSYHMLVLQTVLGEVTAKILEKSGPDELPDRLRIYHSTLLDCGIDFSCLPGVDRRAPRYMLDLQEVDDRLDPNDALIISQVLADPDSKVTPRLSEVF